MLVLGHQLLHECNRVHLEDIRLPVPDESTINVIIQFPLVLTGNRSLIFTTSLSHTFLYPATMMSSPWTPIINDNSFSVMCRKTHDFALHCSGPIPFIRQFTSNMCHSFPACLSPYRNLRSRTIFSESSPQPGRRRRKTSSLKGACTNTRDTSKYYTGNPFSLATVAIILTGADAGVGEVVSLKSTPAT